MLRKLSNFYITRHDNKEIINTRRNSAELLLIFSLFLITEYIKCI